MPPTRIVTRVDSTHIHCWIRTRFATISELIEPGLELSCKQGFSGRGMRLVFTVIWCFIQFWCITQQVQGQCGIVTRLLGGPDIGTGRANVVPQIWVLGPLNDEGTRDVEPAVEDSSHHSTLVAQKLFRCSWKQEGLTD